VSQRAGVIHTWQSRQILISLPQHPNPALGEVFALRSAFICAICVLSVSWGLCGLLCLTSLGEIPLFEFIRQIVGGAPRQSEDRERGILFCRRWESAPVDY